MSTNYTNNTNKNRNSFTLIELLVVLALVAILSVVVVMTLNPAELIKQARDSNRLSDLSTINTALNLFSADVTSGFMGTSTVVYVSIPDNASSTCGSLGLPTLPSGYTYNCVSTANLRNTDGTGWIPVNFQRISSNSPISQLPVDSTNTTSSGNYYTYMTGGSWELASNMESAKQKSITGASGTDGGVSLSSYEIGNNLRLIPSGILEWKRDSSLVGYWTFDEGSGATVYDYSGSSNNGIWGGNGTHYVTGKVGVYSARIGNVTEDYVLGGQPDVTLNVTYAGWFKLNSFAGDSWASVFGNFRYSGGGGATGSNFIPNNGSIKVCSGNNTGAYMFNEFSDPTVTTGLWIHGVSTYNGTEFQIYINGRSIGTAVRSLSHTNTQTIIGRWSSDYAAYYSDSYVDDFRIYNRALSAAEVLALYDATK